MGGKAKAARNLAALGYVVALKTFIFTFNVRLTYYDKTLGPRWQAVDFDANTINHTVLRERKL